MSGLKSCMNLSVCGVWNVVEQLPSGGLLPSIGTEERKPNQLANQKEKKEEGKDTSGEKKRSVLSYIN